MKESKTTFVDSLKSHAIFCAKVLLVVAAYRLACMAADRIVPHVAMTGRSASEFWLFGVSALIFCAIAVLFIKAAWIFSLNHATAVGCTVFALLFEALIFVGAAAIWREAKQYAAQLHYLMLQPVEMLNSGVDIRYWVAAVLFTHGIAGNLLGIIFASMSQKTKDSQL